MDEFFAQPKPVSDAANTPPVTAPPRLDTPAPERTDRRKTTWRLDALIFLLLCLAALPIRFASSHGDLWQDEADYAVASMYGLAVNRWDKVIEPNFPPKLYRLRHYHPPLVTELIYVARQFGNTDTKLRFPFLLMGIVTIGMAYLCGVILFGGRRDVAAVCAIIVLFTPAHIRASSHALPWSPITLGILLLFWTLLKFQTTRRPGWLIGAWSVLGVMFVLSEMIFPLLLACGLMLPLLFLPERNSPERHRSLFIAFGLGIVFFFAIALLCWPAGLTGGAWRTLSHYLLVSKAGDIAVLVGRDTYSPAPKWAFLYWYATDYKIYFALYALGAVGVVILAWQHRRMPGLGLLLVLTLVLLASAHAAHIIGPEYLVHCLPLLTLLTGFFFLIACEWKRWVGVALMTLACLAVGFWRPKMPLAGMDVRSRWSRWPAATRFIAAHWTPGHQIIAGPQPPNVVLWYLRYRGHLPIREEQIQVFPLYQTPAWMLHKIADGVYPYCIVSSTFKDINVNGKSKNVPGIQPDLRWIMRAWPVAWKSEEGGLGPPRLTIFRIPPGGGPHMPHPLPPIPKATPSPLDPLSHAVGEGKR